MLSRRFWKIIGQLHQILVPKFKDICIPKYTKSANNSPVHVVLVSLLVDQLSSLFLPFFGRPKKNLFTLREFLVRLWFFWSTKFLFGIPKFLFSIPKNQSLTKKKFRDWPKIPRDWTIFFLVDQKKWEKDRTIGRPRDWPKPHGRDLRLKTKVQHLGWPLKLTTKVQH